ncbi:hypothetical protein L6164_001446 [Bauhinia variegata]|uniref:Uncharacterized protein n=1 Tax=Bauhinia variegata TaxID=167791 RepID=A0ACB9Q9K7_BAUVA|nr:hypothetical protein L6164_001446 [Bauhinia variegata]
MLGKREREEEAGEEMDNSGWRTAGGSTRSSKMVIFPRSSNDCFPICPTVFQKQSPDRNVGSSAETFFGFLDHLLCVHVTSYHIRIPCLEASGRDLRLGCAYWGVDPFDWSGGIHTLSLLKSAVTE